MDNTTEIAAIITNPSTQWIVATMFILFFCCFLGAVIFYMINKKEKDDSDLKEGSKEDKEPEEECIFQSDYDEIERKWSCELAQCNIYCEKNKCPLWRNGKTRWMS